MLTKADVGLCHLMSMFLSMLCSCDFPFYFPFSFPLSCPFSFPCSFPLFLYQPPIYYMRVSIGSPFAVKSVNHDLPVYSIWISCNSGLISLVFGGLGPRSPVTYIFGSCPWFPIETYTIHNPRTYYMGTWASRVGFRGFAKAGRFLARRAQKLIVAFVSTPGTMASSGPHLSPSLNSLLKGVI